MSEEPQAADAPPPDHESATPGRVGRVSSGNNMNGKYCRECAGLPHRREKPYCPACFEPFKLEPEVRSETRNMSPIAYFVGF